MSRIVRALSLRAREKTIAERRLVHFVSFFRLLARAVQQSCLQPSSGLALHVSVEREVVSLFERQVSSISLLFGSLLLSPPNLTSPSSLPQSFAQDSHLTPFLPQYRGLSHLWLAVEAHCFSSGSSSQPLLRHASESARSFRSALTVDPPPEAAKVKSPLVVTNRQPKERPVRRPVRGAAAATTTTTAAAKETKGKATPAGKVGKSESPGRIFDGEGRGMDAF